METMGESLMPPSKTCELCPALKSARTQIVFGRSVGDKPTYAFIGQNPGKEEDDSGRPFVGQSGQVLAALLKGADISLQDVYLDNAVKCLSPGNRKPKTPEITACHNFLLEDLKAIDPQVIITMGGPAAESLYGKTSLDDVIGRVYMHPVLNKPVVPTYHPAFLLRGQWSAVPLVLAHLETAKRVVAGTQQVEEMGEYHTITTLDQLRALRDYLLSCDMIHIDSETTGLNWMTDEIMCLSFAGKPGEGYTVPILQRGLPTEKGFTDPVHFWDVEEERDVNRFLAEILWSNVPKALQNGSFDIRFFERGGGDRHVTALTAFDWHLLNLRQDTLLLSRTINENLPSKLAPHEQSALLGRHTGMPAYGDELKKASANKTKMAEADDDLVWGLAAADADGVARLTPVLVDKLVQDGDSQWAYNNITIPMVRACQEMTRRGLLVDVPYFDKLCKWHDGLAEDLSEKVYEAAGQEFNINSPQQVQKVLFEDMGLTSLKKTDAAADCPDCQKNVYCKKHNSTDEESLLALKEQAATSSPPPTVIPLLDAILEWRSLHKRRGTYLAGTGGASQGFKGHIRPDDRIHFSFNVLGAATQRLSSQDPNGQNIPKDVKIPELKTKNAFRRTFIAPEGHVLMEADWCLAPKTRVLTEDLRWKPCREVVAGDRLIAIDEEISNTAGRKYRTTTVQHAGRRRADCYSIRTNLGEVIASADHPWLTRIQHPHGVYKWTVTRSLYPGMKIRRGPSVWEEPTDEITARELGYLGGVFDREGSLYTAGRGAILSFSQRPGKVLDYTIGLLEKYGFSPRDYGEKGGKTAFSKTKDCRTYYITDMANIMRFLGMARPLRLLEKAIPSLWEGRRPGNGRYGKGRELYATVESVEFIGEREVVSLQTDTHTFIAEGMFTHNCQLELWVLAYKLAEEFGDRALLDMLESGVDVHTVVSRAIWPDIGADLDDFEWEKEHDETRTKGKVFTFGITYGMTVMGIQERLRCGEAEAASLLSAYFGIVPGLPAYIESVHKTIRAGDILENVWGMRRRFPEAAVMLAVPSSRVNYAIEDLYRIGVNWPIQSGGGGLHNQAHIKSEQSEQLNERAKIVNAVHDSCLSETPAPDLATCLETAWMIKQFWQGIAMNTVRPNGEKLGWQVPVEVKWGHDWGDLHHVLTAKGEYLDEREKERERAEDAQAAEGTMNGERTL
jgi:uracil-DNA glycosylase family 4